jgi:hypothetical protein
MVRVLVAGLAAVSLGACGRAAAGVSIRPGVEVFGADPQHLQLVRWALGRFSAAGLGEPVVQVRFDLGSAEACHGGFGWARARTVDLCTGLGVNLMTRHIVLHEVSHIWLDENLDPWTRAMFLRMRGLRSWNSADVPWELRGYEQGAEIISWELGGRLLAPMIPERSPAKMAAAYRVLTGERPPG